MTALTAYVAPAETIAHLYRDCPDASETVQLTDVALGTLEFCRRCTVRTIVSRHATILRPCGTHAAHERHRVHGEQPCDECQKAERAYQREAKRRQRAAA